MIALAVLVCGCVLAALAGPAQSLRIRTQALHQTLNKLPADSKTVQVTATLSAFDSAVQLASGQGPSAGSAISAETLTQTRADLRTDLASTPLPLGRGDWAGVATQSRPLLTSSPRAMAQADLPPQMDPIYRDTTASNLTVLAGTLTPPAVLPRRTVAVSVTSATAYRFELRPGSLIELAGKVNLLVTAVVRPRDGASTFWTDEQTAAAPVLESVSERGATLYYWAGSALLDPGQFGRLLSAFASETLFEVQWNFPVDTSRLTADDIGSLRQELNRAVNTQPSLPSTGADAVSANISVSTPMLRPVTAFAAEQESALAVLLLMFVSLILVGASVIVLAARMIVAGRHEELTMLRARGAANWQVAWLMLRSSATVTIPAAAAGGLVSLAVGGTRWLGWPLAAFVGVVAIAGPPLVALWQFRRPAPPRNRARVTGADPRTRRLSTPALRRLVTEVAACAASVGGLVVLHGQGVQPGGTNWYLTVTPILVAIPAVVIILRAYPMIIRLLLRLTARRASTTSYVALAGSARTSLAAVGPAFALVLALALATFAGMVNDAVSRGQVAQSWQQSGADVSVNRDISLKPISLAAQRAVAAVPGVTATAAVWHDMWNLPRGTTTIEIAVVDPATYIALTGQTPFPRLAATDLSVSGGVNGAVVNPAAAALLGSQPVTLTAVQQSGSARIRVTRIVGNSPAVVNAAMPWAVIAWPRGILDLPRYEQPAVDQLLVTGGVDRAALAKVLNQWLPGSNAYYRADTYSALHDSPLSRGAQQLMLLTVLAAAGLGLVNLILGLALGAADREVTIARLAVMGYQGENRLVIAETMPAILAASVAGLGCALVLPSLVGSALDLSVFTGSGTAVRLSPGFTALAVPAGVLILLALVTLITQTRLARHRGITGLLRAS